MKSSRNRPLGTSSEVRKRKWVQTERKAHEAWAILAAKKPRAAALLHHLVANMGDKNAVVVSQKSLAKMMGTHIRTVQRAIEDLVEGRWIQVVKLGQGREAAYVVNDRVAWGQKRSQLGLSPFSAMVIADVDDQDEAALSQEELQHIPTLYPVN